mmetsp:Transcript_25003/g.18866  ORF Transcript_25003/g.18866 Transcript_25003/m.18866 type:complete len:89 (+) Transcript_25003:368-634(+)|eukprot:CAMPEP_0202956388 /NCGR_PEP_ID=MMETSP1396-20130829/899_1 /ASSEMBLY_ACC=CAM_ASM_000872 /TAXON_ID= /ORGANISM="Pseudokeronopsis sp., Strain Brazil" /LENGTH=88 /DNA_ID=CAMNT_0049673379 /DNA_START=363 /DNA_END=629 /DNA_ORIENTATION=-
MNKTESELEQDALRSLLPHWEPASSAKLQEKLHDDGSYMVGLKPQKSVSTKRQSFTQVHSIIQESKTMEEEEEQLMEVQEAPANQEGS